MCEEDDNKTSDLCTAKHVEIVGDEVRLNLWHPQWGGYRSHAKVTFNAKASGADSVSCFDVENFHDGDFPSCSSTTYHYCDAAQLIEFGLSILEAQKKYQKTEAGAVARVANDDELVGFVERLQALKTDGGVATGYQIYATAMGASRRGATTAYPGALVAKSTEEAIGEALIQARDLMPEDKGFASHRAAVTRIDLDKAKALIAEKSNADG